MVTATAGSRPNHPPAALTTVGAELSITRCRNSMKIGVSRLIGRCRGAYPDYLDRVEDRGRIKEHRGSSPDDPDVPESDEKQGDQQADRGRDHREDREPGAGRTARSMARNPEASRKTRATTRFTRS